MNDQAAKNFVVRAAKADDTLKLAIPIAQQVSKRAFALQGLYGRLMRVEDKDTYRKMVNEMKSARIQLMKIRYYISRSAFKQQMTWPTEYCNQALNAVEVIINSASGERTRGIPQAFQTFQDSVSKVASQLKDANLSYFGRGG